MTPCKAGRSDLAGSWTSFTRNVIFSAENSYPLQLVQLQQKREISPGPYEQSTRENNLCFPHWTICAMLGGRLFSDACVRPRLLRLPAKPSSSGVSTTCLSSCFPLPFCSCTRRVRVKTVNRNYCISSNQYWVAVPRLACSRRLWLIVAPLNRASANTRAFFSRIFPTIWEPGNRLSLDHLSINRLPRIIVSHTSCHPLFFLPSPCQVDVESDPANGWSMTIQTLTLRILTLKINQGTKFETL